MWNIPLGMNVKDNPLVNSPYSIGESGDYSVTSPVGSNFIIGGNFYTNPWQRGTSFTSFTSGTFSADRYKIDYNSTAVADMTKVSSAPSIAQCGVYAPSSFGVTVTTGDNSVDPVNNYYIRYGMEGYDFSPLYQNSFTVSFWVYTTVPGIYCVAFQDSTASVTYVTEYEVHASNTWEYKTVHVTQPQTIGTWVFTNTLGLGIKWVMMAGSNFFTTPNKWQSGNLICTSNQVNAVATAGNVFYINLINLNLGNLALPYQEVSIQETLSRCQRYFFKTFSQGVTPAQNTGDFNGALTYRITNAGVSANGAYLFYPSKMRNAPSVTSFSPGAATGFWYNQTLAAASGAPQQVSPSMRGLFVTNTTSTGGLVGNQCAIHLIGSAEI